MSRTEALAETEARLGAILARRERHSAEDIGPFSSEASAAESAGNILQCSRALA